MKKNLWLELQLFAQGDGAPAQAGEGAEPGQQPQASQGMEVGSEAQEPAGRMSWEQILQDPEYNAKLQRIVQDRLKSARQAEAALKTLEPALQTLARRHGLGEKDYEKLTQAIAQSEERRAAGQSAQRQLLQRHMDGLIAQSKAMQTLFPDFDLEKELRDPMFARLTGPGVGLKLEDAYYALHRDRFQAATAQVTASHTARKLTNAIVSGSLRPAENGAAGTGASLARLDYAAASPEQRSALKQRIRQAAARGEKVYPGR